MASKTFKSAKSTLELTVVRTNEDLLRVGISTPGVETFGCIDLPSSNAPALALAILEAAGHGGSSESSRLMQAFDLIELHVKEQERITAEAKEQAELEAEALELANSAVLVVGNPPYPSIGHMSDTSLRKWLAVARKAREMRTEK